MVFQAAAKDPHPTDFAVVTGVDLAAGTLTLDRTLAWDADQGVALAYVGDAPDVGAFEVGGAECGDGACDGGETCLTCEGDCGACPVCSDDDGDGYGDPTSPACTHAALDCDDSNDAVNPGAVELCDDSVDNDCNGLIDDDDSAWTPDPDPPGNGGDDGCGCAVPRAPAAPLPIWLGFTLLIWHLIRRRQQ